MNPTLVAYEFARVLISLTGTIGAATVLWEAVNVLHAQRGRGSRLLDDIHWDHLTRAAGLLAGNAALLISASASTYLTMPSGEDWREWARIVAIIFISLLLAIAPWWEHWRRNRLRRDVRQPAAEEATTAVAVQIETAVREIARQEIERAPGDPPKGP